MSSAAALCTPLTLRPQVWIVTPWHVAHPDMKPLERMLSPRLYPGPRDLYLTQITRAAALVDARWLARARSLRGDVVVRVTDAPEFEVAVTDSGSEADRVVAARTYRKRAG